MEKDLYIPNLIPIKIKGKWGLCDKDKNIIIPCIYEVVEYLGYGLAKVNICNDDNEYTLIDREGKKIIAKHSHQDSFLKDHTWFNNMEILDENIIMVTRNDSKCIINRQGEILIYIGKLDKKIFWDNSIIICSHSHYYSNYSEVLSLSYSFLSNEGIKLGFFEDISYTNNFIVNSYQEWGIIYHNTATSITYKDDFMVVKKDSKYGMINKLCEVVIEFIYNECFSFNNGIAWVNKNGKYGCINLNGEEVIPFIYTYKTNFSNDVALVVREGVQFKITRPIFLICW